MTSLNKPGIIFSQLNLPHNLALEPFIYTDILAEYAGNHQTNCFHFWSMPNQVVLGMKDTRVNELNLGVESIVKNGYYPVVRNSGGLAVVADTGILNFSIIIPQLEDKFAFSIDDGYQWMKTIIEEALSDFNSQIDAFEVVDSYCPGDFDLSINGQKFAGISQRRIKKGIAILIYLGVSGNQESRGKLVREFYQVSLNEDFGKNGYPAVNPDSMATLSDLLQTELTVEEMQKRLIDALSSHYEFNQQNQEEFSDFLESSEFKETFTFQKTRMEQRNELINWGDLN